MPSEHKTTRINSDTVEYRGYFITKDARKRGYWDHYTTGYGRRSLSAPTLTVIKQQIDLRRDKESTMGLQRYRFDLTGEPEQNGSVPLYSQWNGGRSLAGIRNCPCGDYSARTVYITGEPDTMFSIPAAISVLGKTVKGWVGVQTVGDLDSGDRLGYTFHPYKVT